MDFVQRGKMGRREREDAITLDLKGGEPVSIEDLIRRHPRSSVYSVLKRLKEKEEGRYVKVEHKGKLVKAFQLLEKKAPSEEVKMFVQLLSSVSGLDAKREAAKDLMALASKYEIIPSEGINFLLENWYRKRYAEVQKYLLATLLRVAATAKAKGFHEVIDKVKCTTDEILEIAKDLEASDGLRQDAWMLLILLEEPRITDAAFELLIREEEQEGVMDFVREEVKGDAEKNPVDAKKRLYDILLRLVDHERTRVRQRILYLLRAIRYPRFPSGVSKMPRYTVTEPEAQS